jgi:hypothetical protein
LLAGLLGAQVQVKAALLHACEHAMTGLRLSGCSRGFAGFPTGSNGQRTLLPTG